MYQYAFFVDLYSFRLENHCTRTAQSSHGGRSRRVHKTVYLAVKNGNILVNILLLKFLLELLSLINPAVYLLNKICVGYSARVMPKM